MNSITLTWNGHSCFTAEAHGYSVVIDPYGPGVVPGLSPLALTADQILCSHEHSDHGFRDAVALRETHAENPFIITVLDTFHDDQRGALRGMNKIHILESDGIRAAHLGDLGCALTEDQEQALGGLDALMIPVGGYYTIDAEQAKALVDILKPQIVVPMHYRTEHFGYPMIGLLKTFTDLCGGVIAYETNRISITKNLDPQTAALSYLP